MSKKISENYPATSETRRVVAYVGASDVRFIGVYDFRANGITQSDAQWDASNDWKLEVENFSDQSLAFLEADTEDFRVLDVPVPPAPLELPEIDAENAPFILAVDGVQEVGGQRSRVQPQAEEPSTDQTPSSE